MGTLPDGLDNIGDSLPKKMVAPMDIKNLDPTENTNSAELYSKKKITCTGRRVHDPNVENKQSTAPNMGKTRPLAGNSLPKKQNSSWAKPTKRPLCLTENERLSKETITRTRTIRTQGGRQTTLPSPQNEGDMEKGNAHEEDTQQEGQGRD